MEMRAVSAELFHADGQRDGQTVRRTDGKTDMTKLM
jgi:hypothetical protein